MKQKQYKIKLPVWAVVTIMLLSTVAISAAVVEARMKSLIQDMSDIETMYIQETGKYPDWFLEWLNTEYLPGHMED